MVRSSHSSSYDDKDSESYSSSYGGSLNKVRDGASSFTGGLGAGWVMNIVNEGPTLYFSGLTDRYSEIDFVNKVYRPTHVIMPFTDQCPMGTSFDAATACSNYLSNCHTVIPIYERRS